MDRDELTTILAELAGLQARIAGLEARIAALEAAKTAIEAARLGEREVVLGGKRVRLRPLSVVDWIAANEQLPTILWTYLAPKAQEVLPLEELERGYNEAKKLVHASLPEDERHLVDEATIPEVMAAVRAIVELNGLHEGLREFFRRASGTSPASGHGG